MRGSATNGVFGSPATRLMRGIASNDPASGAICCCMASSLRRGARDIDAAELVAGVS